MKRAFTLIELLVVIAIIVALLAILMPSMGRAIEVSQRAVCLSNQRQIAHGGLSYATDHFGATPKYKTWSPHIVSGPNGGQAFDERQTLLNIVGDDPGVFYCPSDQYLAEDGSDVGWNADANNTYVTRYMSYSAIGMWEQSVTTVDWTKHYAALPVETNPTLDDQGNRPQRWSEASFAASIAMVTDSQNSFDASLGLSFTFPGDGLWSESSTYYSHWAYPHRDGDNAWAGGNSVMFDGSGAWGDFNDIVDFSVPFPHNAKWFMHYNRSVYKGVMYW